MYDAVTGLQLHPYQKKKIGNFMHRQCVSYWYETKLCLLFMIDLFSLHWVEVNPIALKLCNPFFVFWHWYFLIILLLNLNLLQCCGPCMCISRSIPSILSSLDFSLCVWVSQWVWPLVIQMVGLVTLHCECFNNILQSANDYRVYFGFCFFVFMEFLALAITINGLCLCLQEQLCLKP